MNHASDQFNAAQKILDANVLVWTMRIRSGVTRAKRRHWYGRLRNTADRAHWSTRRIHRINHRALAEDFRSRLDHRARHARLRRRLRERRTAELDDLNVSETAHVEVFAQKLDHQLGGKIRHETKIQPRHRGARQDRLGACFGVTGVNAADRAGWTKDMFFDERVSLHRADPVADAKLAFETHLVEFDRFQHFRVFVTDRRNVRGEAVDRDHTLWRRDCRERLDQAPRGIRHDRAPLRMQIRARAK